MEILDHLTEILVPIGFFAAVVLSLFFYFRTTKQVRLTLIEKGLYNVPKPGSTKQNHGALKFGIFLIGLALGLFVGYIISRFTSINGVVAFFSMILLFGGISLIVNQFLGAKLSKSDE
jgi:hypothetical protein